MPIIPSRGHDEQWTANKLTDNTAKSPLPSFSEGNISIPEPLDGHSQTHHELEGCRHLLAPRERAWGNSDISGSQFKSHQIPNLRAPRVSEDVYQDKVSAE